MQLLISYLSFSLVVMTLWHFTFELHSADSLKTGCIYFSSWTFYLVQYQGNKPARYSVFHSSSVDLNGHHEGSLQYIPTFSTPNCICIRSTGFLRSSTSYVTCKKCLLSLYELYILPCTLYFRNF